MQRSALIAIAVLVLPGCVDRVITDDLGGGDAGNGEAIHHTIECIADGDCNSDQACFEGVCVGTGALRFSLSWEALSDFDLHVMTPTGAHIHYAVPQAAGGYLDVDDCVDDMCLDKTGVHVENIFFEDNARRGDYQVWVQNFNGSNEGTYTVEVAGDVNTVFMGELPSIEATEGPHYRITWK